MQRTASRYRVHLEVRFSRAGTFVEEYAENLSAGGLFIHGAQNLEPLEDVEVEIDLPGVGSCRVVGRVAHVMDEDQAAALGRSAGAGLEIAEWVDDAHEFLRAYLRRLGRRADATVFAGPGEAGRLLGAAGYRVEPVPPAAEVAAAVGAAASVAGVVVPHGRTDEYAGAARPAGVQVIGMDDGSEIDRVIVRLDAAL